jgi:hypothetical protein
MLNIFCPGYKSTKPLRQLPPNIRVLRLVRMIRAVIDSEDENPFPLPDDIEPAGVVGNLGALSLELSNITRDNISRRFQKYILLIVYGFNVQSTNR